MSSASSPIRDARLAKGLTQEALAFKAGVSLRTVEWAERGKVNPRRSTLRVLEQALDLSEGALELEQAA